MFIMEIKLIDYWQVYLEALKHSNFFEFHGILPNIIWILNLARSASLSMFWTISKNHDMKAPYF